MVLPHQLRQFLLLAGRRSKPASQQASNVSPCGVLHHMQDKDHEKTPRGLGRSDRRPQCKLCPPPSLQRVGYAEWRPLRLFGSTPTKLIQQCLGNLHTQMGGLLWRKSLLVTAPASPITLCH